MDRSKIVLPTALVLAGCVGVLSACKPDTSAPHPVTPNAGAGDACYQIHHAIDTATLDTVDGQLQIKIAAKHDGVPDAIRAAIDEYYRGDKRAGKQAMLTACASAGFPATP